MVARTGQQLGQGNSGPEQPLYVEPRRQRRWRRCSVREASL